MHDGNESLLRGSIRLVFCLNSSIYYFYAIEDLCQKEVSMRSNVKGKYIRNFLIKKKYTLFSAIRICYKFRSTRVVAV